MKIVSKNPLTIILLIHIALLCGCGASVHQQATRAEQYTAASADNTMRSLPPYRLGFGDILEIKFFNNREFNETVPVRPDGRIAIEKVGEIEVAGKTPAYVDSVVTQIYSQFVRSPEVTVIVREFGNNQVYVFGEVYSPGKFPIAQEMTLVQALANAGGPKDTAKLNSVLVIRRDRDGRPTASRVDLWRLTEHPEDASDGAVQPLDVIYVPRTFIANVSSFMSKVYDSVIPPFDAYLRALLYSRQ